MLAFHVSIHRRPPGDWPMRQVMLAGTTYCALDLSAPPPAALLPVTFDDAREALGQFERMFCEPDGAVVWVGDGQPSWQLDGQLHDGGAGLASLELKGTCPGEALDRLLSVVGWPEAELVFQLVLEGAWLDEAEFRRFARTD
jgi:hypothetical protein